MRDVILADRARHTGPLWPVCAFIAEGGHGTILRKGEAGFLPGHNCSVIVVELRGHLYCSPVRRVLTVLTVVGSVCPCGYGDGEEWIELGRAHGTFDGGCHHLFEADVDVE